jgi:Zn-dependent alcohol dehydrogenase
MKSRAALLHAVGRDWQVEEIEVDAPKAGEVVVEWKAAGLCHSDEHLVTGDMVPPEEAWPLMGIDELITKRCALGEINVGYQAMRDGENIRGVIVHG